MKNFIDTIYKNQAFIFKVLLLLSTVFLIVYFFPKGSQFKYNIVKNKPWQYNNLYAPFDYPVYKLDAELKQERARVIENTFPIFDHDGDVINDSKSIAKTLKSYSLDSISTDIYKKIKELLNKKDIVDFIKTGTLDSIERDFDKVQDLKRALNNLKYAAKKEDEDLLYSDTLKNIAE